MIRRTAALWPAISTLFVLFLTAPLVLVVLFSFTNRALAAFPIDYLSLTWWSTMFADPKFWPAFNNSLIISGTVGLVAALVGTVTAVGLIGLQVKRAQMLTAILCLPLMLPPLLLAVSLLTFFSRLGIPLDRRTVILSHLLFTIPFVVLVVYARLRNFDYRVVESARDLGASPFHAFRTVTLPIIRPTVVGAALIAIALSVDDYIVTTFTFSGGATLTTFVVGMIRYGLTPEANAVGTLILAMTVGATLLALWLTRYRG